MCSKVACQLDMYLIYNTANKPHFRLINTQVEDRARDRIDAGSILDLFLHIYEFSTPNTLFECMVGTDIYKARNMSGLDTYCVWEAKNKFDT